MNKIKLYRVTFDVTIQGIPQPRRQVAYAVGTEDLNAVRDYIANVVCQTEAEVEITPSMDYGVGMNHTAASTPTTQRLPITNFALIGIEDLKFDIEFIDIDSLKAAGFIAVSEEAHEDAPQAAA